MTKFFEMCCILSKLNDQIVEIKKHESNQCFVTFTIIFMCNWLIFFFRKKYIPPEKKEGFSEIVKVNFVPKFKDTKLEDLYKKFLIDK